MKSLIDCLMAAFFCFAFLPDLAHTNPYPDENAVPKDPPYYHSSTRLHRLVAPNGNKEGILVLRVDISWDAIKKSFLYAGSVLEHSGTETLLNRSKAKNKLGSFHAVLIDSRTGRPLYFDSIGTGKEMRYLTRAFTFRFPVPLQTVEFKLIAESETSGVMEEVLSQPINPSNLNELSPMEIDLRLVSAATTQPPLILTLYAEGYSADRKERFWSDAKRVSDTLKNTKFPGVNQLEIRAAFSTSNSVLGDAEDLGLPVLPRDSFLGLYFPYWHKFGRWYHIVYPTLETKYRNALGAVAYDYPLAIVDDSNYWGVGNFNEITAIPNGHSSFSYLLLHEFGHFFGLNEEYNGGGATELAFASEIKEPWSQNITFLSEPSQLKWKHLIADSTPIPTPSSLWTGSGPYGAYLGGYADTPPVKKSHIPGKGCTMSSGSKFCPICHEAINQKIKFDSTGAN